MPDAIEAVANDEEWAQFLFWQAQPKPIMLDRNGRCPDVPQDMADELFDRHMSKLKSGEKNAVGFLEGAFEPREIPTILWSLHEYNIRFNLLMAG